MPRARNVGNSGFKESYKAYECKSCALIVWKNMAGRELEREEVKILLENGTVGPLEGFRSKLGRPFSAAVKLDGEFKQAFDFGDSGNGNAQVLDFSSLPAIAPCPACKSGTVHDTGEPTSAATRGSANSAWARPSASVR